MNGFEDEEQIPVQLENGSLSGQTGNGTNPLSRQEMHPEWFFILVGSIYMVIFIIGAVGNLVVLYGFSKNRKLRQTISNTYIWHLAITDFMFVCTLPFFAIDYFNRHVWVFGTWMCKVCRSVSKINMYSSIFFLTALSVDRTLAVTKPTTTTWLRTRQGIRNISISIWISSCILISRNWFILRMSGLITTIPCVE